MFKLLQSVRGELHALFCGAIGNPLMQYLLCLQSVTNTLLHHWNGGDMRENNLGFNLSVWKNTRCKYNVN